MEIIGNLTCNWQEVYQSQNLSGTILVILNVSKFDNHQYAQALFTYLQDDLTTRPQHSASEPDSCTIAVEDFGTERSFYVIKNIYVGGWEAAQ